MVATKEDEMAPPLADMDKGDEEDEATPHTQDDGVTKLPSPPNAIAVTALEREYIVVLFIIVDIGPPL